MGSCYLSSEIKGVPISKTPGCPKGFYCPEAFRRRIASEVCPSTIECTLLRLSGGTCEAQGFLEPVLCPPGSLCKDGLTKARCPEGHFCPSGTHEARACGPLSTCGAGSTAPTNFLGLATCGVIDLILILALFYSIRARSTRALRYMVQHRWHSGKSAPGNIILPKRSRVKSRIKSTILRKPAASAIIDTNFDEDTFVVVSNLNVSGEVNSGDMEEYLESLDDPEKDSEAILNRIRNSTKENKDLELSDVDTQHQPADSRDESFSDLEQMYGKFLGPEALQADIHFSAVCLSGQGRTYGRFSGSFKSRMLTAVIGTREAYGGEFIEVLAGRRDKFSGEVKLGDRSIDPRDVQSLFGYVNRNPSFFANLSVRDNIWYSAYIRRPSNADSADIETSLRCIMDALGLSAVSDRMVTEYGGQNLDSSQRIRLAIAMELVSFPQVLFLDNPTDGMDHESALNVVKVLKELTSMGITTVGTFSQPSNQALRLFDEIAVVGSGGEIVYLGSHSEIQRYFEGLGYQVKPSSFGRLFILSWQGPNL